MSGKKVLSEYVSAHVIFSPKKTIAHPPTLQVNWTVPDIGVINYNYIM